MEFTNPIVAKKELITWNYSRGDCLRLYNAFWKATHKVGAGRNNPIRYIHIDFFFEYAVKKRRPHVHLVDMKIELGSKSQN